MALIIAMIGISFEDGPLRDDVLTYPFLYSFCYVFNSTATVCFFRFYLSRKDPDLVIPPSSSSSTKSVLTRQGTEYVGRYKNNDVGVAAHDLEDLGSEDEEDDEDDFDLKELPSQANDDEDGGDVTIKSSVV